MTAAREHSHPSWSLPFHYHDQHPTNPADRAEWAIEQLVSEYCDTDDERWFRMIEDHRPDLPSSRVWELVDELCDLSNARADVECSTEGARKVATAEYLECLMRLANRPVGA